MLKGKAKSIWAFVLIAMFSGYVDAATTEPCGAGTVKSGKTFKVNGDENILRASPSDSGQKLVNEKATAILKKTMYLTIDNSTTVLEECTKGEWSKVKVLEPDWLRATHIGWVKASVLRKPKVDGAGRVEFTEADFSWDKKTSPYKKIIVAGVNKVHRENARCKKIDPASAYISSSKGTPSNPVFFVTCGSGADIFNAFFSKSDVEGGKTLAAAKHISKEQAVNLCESYVKSQASHPSTVDFSRFMDLAVSNHANGNTQVTTSFTAKNSFGLELKHNVRCLLNAGGFIEGHITESQ